MPLAAYDGYYEPFLGGGALAFALMGRDCGLEMHLGDTNRDLVNFYRVVRDRPSELMAAMAMLAESHAVEQFAEVRSTVSLGSPVDRAAKFWYLNQTAFNGLWRVNKSGQFNTPWDPSAKCRAHDLGAASALLKGVHLAAGDFKILLSQAGPKSLVYCDPPYLPQDGAKSFTAYDKNPFGFAQHDDLLLGSQEAVARGATVFISNSDSSLSRSLYEGHTVYELTGNRSIAADKAKRGACSELLVRVVA
jgi:DNA adenine methylase